MLFCLRKNNLQNQCEEPVCIQEMPFHRTPFCRMKYPLIIGGWLSRQSRCSTGVCSPSRLAPALPRHRRPLHSISNAGGLLAIHSKLVFSHELYKCLLNLSIISPFITRQTIQRQHTFLEQMSTIKFLIQ